MAYSIFVLHLLRPRIQLMARSHVFPIRPFTWMLTFCSGTVSPGSAAGSRAWACYCRWLRHHPRPAIETLDQSALQFLHKCFWQGNWNFKPVFQIISQPLHNDLTRNLNSFIMIAHRIRPETQKFIEIKYSLLIFHQGITYFPLGVVVAVRFISSLVLGLRADNWKNRVTSRKAYPKYVKDIYEIYEIWYGRSPKRRSGRPARPVWRGRPPYSILYILFISIGCSIG